MTTRAERAARLRDMPNVPSNVVSVETGAPLTDSQLRAAPVPVSGPLTDTQLRASAVPVSAASLPLPSGAATESTLAALQSLLAAVVHDIAIATRDVVHEKIHDGLLFSACDEQNAIANNAVVNYLFTADAGKDLHLVWEIDGDIAMRVEFFSGTTTSASGTLLDTANRNIGSANVSGATVHRGPTITADGTKRCMARVGNATVGARSGGTNRAGHEWVIPAGTKALIRITSLSGASASLNAASDFIWYEV